MGLGEASRWTIQQVIREVTWGRARPLGRLSSKYWIAYMGSGEASRWAIQQVIGKITWGQRRRLGRLSSR